MSRTRLLYIEPTRGYSHDGPAWIGRAKLSKSGNTLYFDGKALKHCGARCLMGNHYDLESNEEYWVSGIKKKGTNRHWAGKGKIKIDAQVVSEYLSIVGQTRLDPNRFEVCTDIQRFREIENENP